MCVRTLCYLSLFKWMKRIWFIQKVDDSKFQKECMSDNDQQVPKHKQYIAFFPFQPSDVYLLHSQDAGAACSRGSMPFHQLTRKVWFTGVF